MDYYHSQYLGTDLACGRLVEHTSSTRSRGPGRSAQHLRNIKRDTFESIYGEKGWMRDAPGATVALSRVSSQHGWVKPGCIKASCVPSSVEKDATVQQRVSFSAIHTPVCNWSRLVLKVNNIGIVSYSKAPCKRSYKKTSSLQ